MSKEIYDVCIVGAGLIGSAAAKYCAKKGFRTLLIGTEEPANKSEYAQRELFGGHYDCTRITRNLDPNIAWGFWARESINRYRNIETESGIHFFDELGYMICADHGHDYISKNMKIAEQLNINTRSLSMSKFEQMFPYFNVLPNMEFLYEPDKSGSVNPRNMLLAQKFLAEKYGCHIVSDAVIKVENNHENTCFKLTTAKSGFYHSRKTLLCTGAFIEHKSLLPKGMKLDLNITAETVARFAVPDELRTTMKNMPSLIFVSDRTFSNLPEFSNGVAFYLTPAIKYPDGKYYIKIGHSDHSRSKSLCSPSELTAWYRYDDQEMGKLLAKVAKIFIPALDTSRMEVSTCAFAETPAKMPYIDEVAPGLFISTGCNGWAAKSSDELGRVSADVAMGEPWTCPFPQEWIKARVIRSAL